MFLVEDYPSYCGGAILHNFPSRKDYSSNKEAGQAIRQVVANYLQDIKDGDPDVENTCGVFSCVINHYQVKQGWAEVLEKQGWTKVWEKVNENTDTKCYTYMIDKENLL